ncbi:Fibronectin type III domain-containing protein [Paenibacillus sp. UNCCL117]|uniref:CBM96 family carbohydrate-binding protein n=1 Tax=unclassified Paenibacillus TaxID=185978 RepID=UPI000880E951|nr:MULTISPECIES: DNRLRE domain-containing protein [unclassified Paenibacillus]SDE02532.1 Fibronectin type III domain-containing protein [Paenibacillus sp. cl123]SFW57232.1 Fibronectin type III domain-containing protein [Paenibacillus sp. UNCCL117]
MNPRNKEISARKENTEHRRRISASALPAACRDKTLLGLLLISLLCMCLPLARADALEDETWRSALYPSTWTPGYADSEGRFLHDFSYAGYRKGEQPLPTVVPGVAVQVTDAPYNADPTGLQDSTAAIQQAIDDVGLQGGGVVYVPEGVYRIKPQAGNAYSLTIAHSGVVLRGAGADKTFLFNDEINMRQKNIVLIRPAAGDWYEPVSSAVYAAADIPNQSTELSLDNVSGLATGDWIVITGSVTEDFMEDHGMTGYWDTSLRGPAFYRQITDIDALNSKITIDIPTRYELKIRDQARVYKVAPHISEVGVEDLAIGNKENPKSGWTETDYNVPGTGAYDAHNSNAILLTHVVDGWMQRVHSYRPDGNIADHHLLSNGIKFLRTRNVTISDCFMSSPQSITGGGNGYMYTVGGNEGLIQFSRAAYGRHNFSFQHMAASGNVLYRNTSSNPAKVSDFHNFLSMSNLYDNMTLNNDTLESVFRHHGSQLIHGQTGTQNTFWNTHGNGGLPGSNQHIAIDSRQYGYGYIIGTWGKSPSVRTTPTIMREVETAPEDWKEGIGLGQTLAPQSLYADQLYKRAGLAPMTPPAPPEEPATRFPVSEDAYVYGGSPASNYATAENLAVKGDTSAAYIRKAYMKVDMQAWDGAPADQARLYFYSSTVVDATYVRVLGLADDSWSETGITWNNQPTATGQAVIGTVPVSAAGWYSIDVTDYINAEVGDKTATFLLDVPVKTAAYIRIHSREQATNQPYVAFIPDDSGPPIWPARAQLTGSQAMHNKLMLNWPAAKDDIAVAGYEVYRDQVLIGTTGAGASSYPVTGLAPSTAYAFTVKAYDAAGNRSGALVATLSTSEDNGRFIVTRNTYVTGGSSANENFGSAANVIVKSDPGNKSYERRGYLQIDVTDFAETEAQSALLRFYKNSATDSVTLSVYGVADDNWTETGLTWNNQPPLPQWSLVGTVTLSDAGWYSLDVTSYLNQQLSVSDKLTSFVLTGPGDAVSPYISIASNKHAVLYPYLELE